MKYNVKKIAVEFALILNDWLTEDEMYQVNEENEVVLGCCATHNFCDANEAMLEALNKCGYGEEEWDDLNSAMNDAWALAKIAGFDVEVLKAHGDESV